MLQEQIVVLLQGDYSCPSKLFCHNETSSMWFVTGRRYPCWL